MNFNDKITEVTGCKSFIQYIEKLIDECNVIFEDMKDKWFLRKPDPWGGKFKKYGKIKDIKVYKKSTVAMGNWSELFTIQIIYDNMKNKECIVNFKSWSLPYLEYFDDEETMLLYKEVGGE